MARPDFVAYWLGPHAEIARRIPLIRGYVINLIEDPDLAGWDGIAETWFDTREDAVRAFETGPVAAELTADRPKFLDQVVVVSVEEYEIMKPPGDAGGGSGDAT